MVSVSEEVFFLFFGLYDLILEPYIHCLLYPYSELCDGQSAVGHHGNTEIVQNNRMCYSPGPFFTGVMAWQGI